MEHFRKRYILPLSMMYLFLLNSNISIIIQIDKYNTLSFIAQIKFYEKNSKKLSKKYLDQHQKNYFLFFQ